MTRINSQDIATLVGVSQATVSRAFTPGASISAKTKNRILDAASRLGYQPNVIARSLSKSQSKMIGVLFANWDHPKAADFLQGICEKLMEFDFKALVQSPGATRQVDDIFRDFLQYQVDGVIVFSASPSRQISVDYARNNIPIVLLNRSAKTLNASSISVDASGLGRRMAKELISRSYSRLAIVSKDSESQVVADMSRSIEEMFLESGQAKIISQNSGVYGYDAGIQCIREMWNQPEKPDAVICTSDDTALGVIAGCRHHLDIDVPHDLGVIGLGDTPVAAWKDHDLTTVRIPHDDLISQTVATLVANIENPWNEPEIMELEANLVIRGSIRGE